jgi:hypothetical protein
MPMCVAAFVTRLSPRSAASTIFPPDFPTPEAEVGLLGMLFSDPGFFSVIVECDGDVVGSNCLDQRSTIAGVGPVTVAPDIRIGCRPDPDASRY